MSAIGYCPHCGGPPGLHIWAGSGRCPGMEDDLFHYWNTRLWQAVQSQDEETEILATTMLYCKSVRMNRKKTELRKAAE